MNACADEKNRNAGNDPGSLGNLIDLLCPDARDDLMKHGIVELVSVSVRAVPDPDRPEDHLAMKIAGEVCDNFRAGIRDIDRDLDRVDAICSASEEDLALVFRDELLVTLDEQRRAFAELREGKIDGRPAPHLSDPAVADLIRPALEHPFINACVWSLGWCAIREEDGRLLVYSETPHLSESVDEDSWVRIQDRMRKVNYIIGGMVSRLLGEA